MAVKVFLFLSLLALSQANQFVLSSHNGKAVEPKEHQNALQRAVEVLKKSDSQELQEIAELLETEAPIDEIDRLVLKIRNTFTNEQQLADEQHNTDSALCEEQKQTKIDEILGLRTSFNAAEATRKKYYSELVSQKAVLLPAIQQKETALQDTEHNLEINKANSETLEIRRQNQIELYEQQTHDHQDAIDALKEIEQKVQDSSLNKENFAASLEQVNSKFTDSIKEKVDLPSVKLLENLLQSNDPADVQRLLDLVRRLISTLESSLHDLHQHEQASSASYDKEVQDLASEKEQLEESRAALSDELTELQGELALSQRNYNGAELEASRYNELLKTALDILLEIVSNCLEKARFYFDQTSHRSHNILALNDVHMLVDLRLKAPEAFASLNE